MPIDIKDLPERFVITVSRQGMIKRSAVSELPGVSASDFVLTKINPDDELFQVLLSDGTQDILLTTASGMCIRFNENDVRAMGLVAAGVNAIKLKEGDTIVGASLLSDKDEVALLTRLGAAKRVPGSDFPLQGRYGQGVIGWRLDPKDQIAAVLVGKLTDKGISHFSKSASKVFTITNAIARKRASNGQAMYTLKSGDEVIGFTTITDYSNYWGEDKA